ncbi:hypothetical protein M422DRAFT_27066 [Sphaerobolus stellatus SS14]|nr:hypothetical protein M422DRAFT_27066 [Sphaerobolus stellatus SS14]
MLPKESTAFELALGEYLRSLPEKKRIRNFIFELANSASSTSFNKSLEQLVQKVEEKHRQKAIKVTLYGVLRRITRTLRDYYDIFDTLVSANPMPAALILGAVKVLIDGVDRFLNMFDIIKDELQSLQRYLLRVTEYEYLYPDSAPLQKFLCQFYVNFLRFWHQVDKECKRSGFNALFSSVAPLSTSKMRKILEEIRDALDQIETEANMAEREEAKEERMLSQRERLLNERERKENAEMRQQQQVDHEAMRCEKVRNWLSASRLLEPMFKRYDAYKGISLSGTGAWLLKHDIYQQWRHGSNPAIVWMYGRPGSGKSVLSTHLIDSLKQTDPETPMAFFFYRFDEEHTALDVTRLLALQLFEKYWTCTNCVTEELYQKANSIINSSISHVHAFIRTLLNCSPKIYVIVDGIDEEWANERRKREAILVLDFLIQLSRDYPSVKLWYSSQVREELKARLGVYSNMDIHIAVQDDVQAYVQHELSSLEVSSTLKSTVIEDVNNRADGHFLWASLMVNTLKNSTSARQVKENLAKVPSNITAYYAGIFNRYEQNHLSLICKLFALLLFARRPLRLKELREAAGILESEDPTLLNEEDLPFITLIRGLSRPLIEIQDDPEDPDDGICHIFHSTLRDFLLSKPDILSTRSGVQNLRIISEHISKACLLYLSQDRYRRPLKKKDICWVDHTGSSVETQHFLLYAAKYWDRHLSDIEETKEKRAHVEAFLRSSNFLTCAQIQGLWIENHFDLFTNVSGGPRLFLRRIFPMWFTHSYQQDPSCNLWEEYRLFLHEWQYFLQCWTCGEPSCTFLHHAGQIDRCFWGALGTDNFMSKFPGRYRCFTFQNKAQDIPKSGICYEGISHFGTEMRLLRLKSRNRGILTFVMEHWHMPNPMTSPVLRHIAIIVTDETTTNWCLYVIGNLSEERIGRAQPISFSADLQFLRIGAAIFKADEDTYTLLLHPGQETLQYPPYIEEFESLRGYTVLTSRQQIHSPGAYMLGLQNDIIEGIGQDLLLAEKRYGTHSYESSAAVYGGYDDDESDSDTSAIVENEADESLSEHSSTEGSESDGIVDDLITPWTRPPDNYEEDQSSVTSEDFNDDANSSDSEESLIPVSRVFHWGKYIGDSDDEGEWYIEPPRRTGIGSDSESDSSEPAERQKPRPSSATLVLLDTKAKIPTKVFEFSYQLRYPLYASSPVIHPSESLLVWPLSGGEVLFADFVAGTYFTRRLRPSTSSTRQISIKCKFSSCGNYLHVAALEGQRRISSKPQEDGKDTNPLRLALVLLTYKLSKRKPTRTPPSLIHRARVQLESVTSLSVSRLPFTYTWTSEDLYVSVSNRTLTVYQIALFSQKKRQDKLSDVLVPQKPIFLPNTANRRPVYFFPATGKMDAKMILGGEAPASKPFFTPAVPIDPFLKFKGDNKPECATNAVHGLQGRLGQPLGCFLRNKDLGDWVISKKRTDIPDGYALGKLFAKMEPFNPEDDCDLELYIY